MKGKPIVRLVASHCRPEEEEKVNNWYEGVHLPMLIKFKGMVDATRYKLVGKAGDPPTYLNVYTFESHDALMKYESSPELAAAMEEKMQTWGKGGGPQVDYKLEYKWVKYWKK